MVKVSQGHPALREWRRSDTMWSMTSTTSVRPAALGIVRSDDDRIVAGLSGGIASRLGIETVYVRAGFVVLSLLFGAGVVLYLAGWAATVDQARTAGDDDPAQADPRQRAGVGLLYLAVLMLFRGVGIWPGDGVVVPLGLVVFGAAFLLDRRAIDSRTALMSLVETPEKPGRSRTVIGIVLLLVGLTVFGGSAAPQLGSALMAVVITGAGLTLLFGPWVWTLAKDLGRERQERIRQEERAEMASHLHDSVLQTLALIQRSDDPKRMVTLARGQERELRKWLFESAPTAGSDRLSSAIQVVADRVEADFDIPVEVIGVGDIELDDSMRALVGATGEALTNAAKHSGAVKISVYHEVTPDAVEVFVTDHGKGFDPGTIAADRHGVSESIIARMKRHGGAATIMSESGEGTEVALTMTRAET